jgi:hypothetical protein
MGPVGFQDRVDDGGGANGDAMYAVYRADRVQAESTGSST